MSDPEFPFVRVGIEPFGLHAFDADIRVAVYLGDNVIDLLLSSLNFHRDRTVEFVFHPSGYAVPFGGVLGLKAKADRLYFSIKANVLTQNTFLTVHLLSRPESYNKTDRKTAGFVIIKSDS